MKKISREKKAPQKEAAEYGGLVGGIAKLLESARRTAARTVNVLMTATYWEIGRRIVEFEQRGEKRAKYGDELLKNLADDLTEHFGRGFSVQNLENMRLFYSAFRSEPISKTLSRKSTQALSRSISQTPSGISPALAGESATGRFAVAELTGAFPLSWSHYVALVRRALLCAEKDDAIAKYALEGLPNKVLAREYKLALPDEKVLAAEIEKTRGMLERRGRR
jgi:DUF1016 N-terminal domain